MRRDNIVITSSKSAAPVSCVLRKRRRLRNYVVTLSLRNALSRNVSAESHRLVNVPPPIMLIRHTAISHGSALRQPWCNARERLSAAPASEVAAKLLRSRRVRPRSTAMRPMRKISHSLSPRWLRPSRVFSTRRSALMSLPLNLKFKGSGSRRYVIIASAHPRENIAADTRMIRREWLSLSGRQARWEKVPLSEIGEEKAGRWGRPFLPFPFPSSPAVPVTILEMQSMAFRKACQAPFDRGAKSCLYL